MSLVAWRFGGRVVGEAEGRAAMSAALATSREHVDRDLPGDVVAFRADGPDWRERMAEPLRKAVGLQRSRRDRLFACLAAVRSGAPSPSATSLADRVRCRRLAIVKTIPRKAILL